MFIDWFTVIAQAVNFLILVWLLKRFLYQPILHAIDERDRLVVERLKDAGVKADQALKERDDFERKNAEFTQQHDMLMAKAGEEAKAERQRLMDAARQESETLRTKLEETLRSEHETLSREVSSRTQQEVFAIARKTLTDLAGVNLEQRMAEVFILRLRGLKAEEKAALASFLHESQHPALVRSAFELPPEQRAAIEQAVRETLNAQTPVQFETAPALVSGIELTTNGHKVAWSIADYLASLEQSIGGLLEGTHAHSQ